MVETESRAGISGFVGLRGASIRQIFRAAFEQAGLRYFHPHSFRKTLARLGENLASTPEQFQAWSQNLGHEKVMTTLTSYGSVARHRQADIMRELRSPRKPTVLTDAGLSRTWRRRGTVRLRVPGKCAVGRLAGSSRLQWTFSIAMAGDS
jgi:hypothetical protein